MLHTSDRKEPHAILLFLFLRLKELFQHLKLKELFQHLKSPDDDNNLILYNHNILHHILQPFQNFAQCFLT